MKLVRRTPTGYPASGINAQLARALVQQSEHGSIFGLLEIVVP